jgi:hypothetical protein
VRKLFLVLFWLAALGLLFGVAIPGVLGPDKFQPFGPDAGWLNPAALALLAVAAAVGQNAVWEWVKALPTGLPPDPDAFFANDDLTRLIGQSLGMILRAAAGKIDHAGDRRQVFRMAERAETDWLQISKSGEARTFLASLVDTRLADYIRDQRRPALTSVRAGLLLDLLAPEGADRRFESPGTEKAVRRQVSARYGEAVRAALKEDGAAGGKAWPALMLGICGKILEALSESVAATAESQSAVAAAADSLLLAADRLDALDEQARRHYRQLAAGLIATHRAVRDEGAASAARDAETHERLARMEAQNREFAEQLREYLAPKQAGEDPTQRQLPPELEAKARELLERGDREQQALAEIALKNHAEADRLIQDLKREPLVEAFRLLTLEGTNWYNAGEFDRAIGPFEQTLALRPGDYAARTWAAIAHSQARLGDIAAHQRRAIELLAGNLALYPDHSPDWAMTQNNLGLAWQGLPTGDRGGNLSKAIAAYTAALEVYTRAAHPVDWAMTQNNLGVAWRNLLTGDRGGNVGKAIVAYTAALEVRTRAAHPVDWAGTQNNLGNAWADLLTGDRGENLGKAIVAYTAALEVRTRAAHPVDWARTHFNLGLAHAYRAEGGSGCSDWREAIAHVRAAAKVLTEAAFPHVFGANIEPTLAWLRTAWREAGCGSDAEFEAIPPVE